MIKTQAAFIQGPHRIIKLLLAGFMALTGAAALAQNLVANGDFTQYTPPANNNTATGLPYTSFNVRGPDVTISGGRMAGWTLANNSVGSLYTGNDNDTLYNTPPGHKNECCFHVWSQANNAVGNPTNTIGNTWDGRGPNGTNFFTTHANYLPAHLSQSVNLQEDQQYLLSFAWAVGQSTNGNEHGWGGWNVRIGNQPVQQAHSGEVGTQQFSGWSTYNYLFTASTTGPALLSFTSVGGQPPMNLLANISVTAVPEPGTVLMFGLGLGALVLIRRRTR